MGLERFAGAEPRVHPTAWVHPAATLIGDVEIGPGSSVWPGAVLRGDFGPVRVGAQTSIQDGVVIHGVGEGSSVGDRCIVGHQAFIEEAVVEDECQIGVGARVLNGARVCSGGVVAAGAVVVSRLVVPSGMQARGVPARLFEATHPTWEEIVRGALVYAEQVARYRAGEWGPLDDDRASSARARQSGE
jgi:carbonic anhydrase/acetyltransferase-like protein (isoleucine patch superfamily)